MFKLELQVQVHNENRKAAQKCILVFQVAQGNAYMSMGPPGLQSLSRTTGSTGSNRLTEKSTKSTSLLNPQRPSWIHCTGSADSIVHWLHWLHQIHQVNEVHNQPVLLVLSGPPSQWYLQAFYIVNDFLNWIIESQRTMLKIIVFLNDYSVILVLYDSWCS